MKKEVKTPVVKMSCNGSSGCSIEKVILPFDPIKKAA